jgi:hypothetical protein
MKTNVRWRTQYADQRLAIDVLRRHCEQFGYVKFLEQIHNIGGDKYEVEFPLWVDELTIRFAELYGPDIGHVIYIRVVEWLVRDVFRGQVAVSIQ